MERQIPFEVNNFFYIVYYWVFIFHIFYLLVNFIGFKLHYKSFTLQHSLGKSADDRELKNILLFLFYFSKKIGFDISEKLSIGGNSHEMSKPLK